MIPTSMFISDGSTEHTCLHCLCTVDGKKFINSVCMAASICLHKFNQLFSATDYRISLLLNGEAKGLAIERCVHLGLSVIHSSAIRLQTKATSTVHKIRKNIKHNK